MDKNKESLTSGYSAEDIARINAIDLSDPNSIAAINAINNTIKTQSGTTTIGYIETTPDTGGLPTRLVENGKILLSKTYGRLRWILVYNPDFIKVEKELQQEVTTQYMGEPSVTEWVKVPIENV